MCVWERERDGKDPLVHTSYYAYTEAKQKKRSLQKDLKNHLLTVGFQNITLLTERFKCKVWGVKRNNNKKDSFFSNFMT